MPKFYGFMTGLIGVFMKPEKVILFQKNCAFIPDRLGRQPRFWPARRAVDYLFFE